MIVLFATTPIEYPSWEQLIKSFGPFLGTLVFFITIIVILQWYWYRKNVKSKEQEIERCVKRITELEKTNQRLIAQLRSK